ncbi:MAG: histidine kinase dimerization/phosphoacceptor domain -containing protein [Cyclobacteriaceae bacterium]
MTTKLSIIFLIVSSFYGSAQSIQLQFGQGDQHIIPSNFIHFTPQLINQKKSFWIKVTIDSQSDKEAVLKAGNWYMQKISFFDKFKEGFFTGNHTEVKLVKGSNIFYLFYPFADDKDGNGVTIEFSEPANFNKEMLKTQSFQLIFASIVLFLFLLSATYSIVLRWEDRIYTHYALYLFTIAIFFTYQYGILGQIFPIIRRIPPAYFWIFSDFITLTFIYFAQSFLNLPKADPFLYKLYEAGKYILGSMVVIETVSYALGIDVLHSLWYKTPIFAFEIVIFPIIFYRVYKLKTTLSWLFLVSSIILAAANLGGQTVSTLKEVDSFNFIIQTGMLIDVFIFSVGIGIRMGIIAKEKQVFQGEFVNQLKINTAILERQASELELKVAERTIDLNKRNQENELLVREIHHRVKNNLQVITSLLNISERKIKGEAAKEPFRDSVNRINSMGLIHSYLYQNEDISDIDIRKYITQLSTMVIDTFRNKYPQVELQVETGSVKLDIDHAIEIGLIINELITNSLKHGVYNGSQPALRIIMTNNTDKLVLTVSDNGQGISSEINTSSSFGLRMISSLVKKMNGDVSIRHEKGFEVKIIMES